MNQTESEFFEQYKKTDNIVRDMLGAETGITSYINEMAEKSVAGLYVDDWDYSLKALKRLRWLRNQLAHDDLGNVPVSTEDLLFLKKFHGQVLNSTDPLSEYEKLVKKNQVAKVASSSKANPPKESSVPSKAKAAEKPSEASASKAAGKNTSKSKASGKKTKSKTRKNTKKKRSPGKIILAVFFILVALFLIYLIIKSYFE